MATHSVSGIPLCRPHATAIGYRLAMQYRNFLYEEIKEENCPLLQNELNKRTCFMCNGYGWLTQRDLCPICVGTGFTI